MPENTVYVGRPTKWGNPFVAPGYSDAHRPAFPPGGRAQAVAQFRAAIEANDRGEWISGGAWCPTSAEIRSELAGKNLACWCPLGQPCHADVLLEIANGDAA